MVKKTRNKCLFTKAMSDASFVKRTVWAGKNAIFSFPPFHATPSERTESPRSCACAPR
jgi:hypothetical protein